MPSELGRHRSVGIEHYKRVAIVQRFDKAVVPVVVIFGIVGKKENSHRLNLS